MARCTRARDRRKRLVLVRLLKKPVVFADAAELAAVEKALKGLKHPAIVPILKLVAVLTLGPGDRRGERIRGGHDPGGTVRADRSARSQGRGPVCAAPGRGARICRQLRSIIHGHLTPDHILTGDDGQPRIGGFRAVVSGLPAGRFVRDGAGVCRARAFAIAGRGADGPDRHLQPGRGVLPASHRRGARPWFGEPEILYRHV